MGSAKSYWLGQSRGQLTNFISCQSITQKQALQSITALTKQICAIALYDGQRRNGLILSSLVLNQTTDGVYSTPALRERDYHVKKSPRPISNAVSATNFLVSGRVYTPA
jgi:hypothetical protein